MKKFFCFIIAILMMSITQNISSNPVEISADTISGLSAKSYVVVDDNGKVLLEHNSDERREVASICKLMTTLLTLEEIEAGNLSLDDKVIASSYACSAEGSQAFLDAGSEYSIRDLLKSVIVASANDSAIVLAETLAGTENSFVKMMNLKAGDLGMENTLYVNSTGLPAKNQYSTARDTAILLDIISDYDLYKEDCKIWIDKLTHPSGRETELVNTNRLIKYYPNCITGKTGFTDEAGYCLSSTAMNNEFKLTCVVLGCDTASARFTDSVTLYNNAYANYKSEKILDCTNEIPNSISVSRGKQNELKVVPQQDYYLTISKHDNETYKIEYEFFETLKAPVSIGDVVGVAKIIINDKIIDEINLVSDVNIDKQSYKDIINKIIEKFSIIK
jgi:D-alanyl-D-alanine carboxypeptidase (penicillin-binding protein 5/6)